MCTSLEDIIKMEKKETTTNKRRKSRERSQPSKRPSSSGDNERKPKGKGKSDRNNERSRGRGKGKGGSRGGGKGGSGWGSGQRDWDMADDRGRSRSRGGVRARQAFCRGRICVTNIPNNLNPTDLEEAFGAVGTVKSVDLSHDGSMAWVQFATPKEAHEAQHRYDGGQINQQIIRVQVA